MTVYLNRPGRQIICKKPIAFGKSSAGVGSDIGAPNAFVVGGCDLSKQWPSREQQRDDKRRRK
jgi:hypothetical protein